MGFFKRVKYLNNSLDKLNYSIEKNNLYDIVELLENKKKMLFRNLIAGMSKGVGIGIGFYFVTALVIYILQYVVKLNIPVIGDYISDVMDIIEINRIK
ncbi:MAG: hypothetical protein IKF52_04300 [Clostridia bacterium]|nr:hypothetical protein [Clostridia bacterium]